MFLKSCIARLCFSWRVNRKKFVPQTALVDAGVVCLLNCVARNHCKRLEEEVRSVKIAIVNILLKEPGCVFI